MAIFCGDRLRTARRAKVLTQDELAQSVGISRTAITHLESSEGDPSVDLLVRLATTLDVSIDWLLGLSAATRPDVPDVMEAYNDGYQAALRELASFHSTQQQTAEAIRATLTERRAKAR